jgi:ferredoxin-like protein FixX
MAINPIGAVGSESSDSNPYERYFRAYYGGAQGYLNYRQFQTGYGQNKENSVGDDSDTVKAGRISSPSECKTCKQRKYQDGSNEMDVSFKSASHISVSEAPSKVRAHEQEHVANAYQKAEENGGKVLQASVSIKTAICPECGTTYVSGGETSTKISYPIENTVSQSLAEDTGLGKVFDSKA